MNSGLWERLVTEPKDKVWKKGWEVSAAQHSLKPWLRAASEWGWNNKDRAWKWDLNWDTYQSSFSREMRPVEAKRFQRIDYACSGAGKSNICERGWDAEDYWVVPIAVIISSFSEIFEFFFFFLKTFHGLDKV